MTIFYYRIGSLNKISKISKNSLMNSLRREKYIDITFLGYELCVLRLIKGTWQSHWNELKPWSTFALGFMHIKKLLL